jgi:hypothetical protein
MSTAGEPPDPIRASIENRDHAAMVELLAPDIVLNSPATSTPIRGRAVVSEVLSGLLKQSEKWADEWGVRRVFREGDTYLIAFGGRVGGHHLEMVNLMKLDKDNKILEMRVYGRPMASVAVFPALVFPQVAQLRSRNRSRVVRVMGRPLPRMLELGARLAIWIGLPRE